MPAPYSFRASTVQKRPASRVFSVNELSSMIFRYLRGNYRSLAAVTRVCKSSKEAALDQLWHTLPGLKPIMHIFEVGAQHSSENPAGVAFALYHTSRVRALSIFMPTMEESISSKDAQYIAEKPLRALLNVLLDSHRLPLFPRLKELFVSGLPVDMVFRFALLAGTEITTVVSEQIPPVDCPLAKNLFTNDNLGPALTEKISRLRKLQLSVHYYSSDWIWADGADEDGILDMREHELRIGFHKDLRLFLGPAISQGRNLTSIRVSPDDTTLYDLALHARLKELHLDVYDETQPDDIPALDESLTDLFPSLDKLSVTIRASLYEPLWVVKAARCFPREELCIRILSYTDLSCIPHLLKDLIDTHAMSGLRRFAFHIPVDLVHPDRSSFRTFDSLLDLHHLEEVTIDLGAAVDLNSADVRAIVEAWPAIRSLSLGATRYSGPTPQLDLDGLSLFSKSSCLEFLCVRVDTTGSSTIDVLPLQSISRLKCLDVGDSPILDPRDVARVLRRSFLLLTTIQIGDSHTDQWREVQDRLRRHSTGSSSKDIKVNNAKTLAVIRYP